MASSAAATQVTVDAARPGARIAASTITASTTPAATAPQPAQNGSVRTWSAPHPPDGSTSWVRSQAVYAHRPPAIQDSRNAAW
ncbi:hypothetical protein [Micromonospora sp. NPDC005172]|uniref:hypothetical protein n=1 Tax=Micromonospora sp. NPDC005172 TaxID=3156867 RepID=UPI0033BE152F